MKNVYDFICICTGKQSDKVMDLGSKKSIPASFLFKWYNGEENQNMMNNINFANIKKVALLGNGNVALDIARMLLRSPESLYPTKATFSFIKELDQSIIDTIFIVGRKSPFDVHQSI